MNVILSLQFFILFLFGTNTNLVSIWVLFGKSLLNQLCQAEFKCHMMKFVIKELTKNKRKNQTN